MKKSSYLICVLILIMANSCIPTTPTCSPTNPPIKNTTTPTLGTWTGTVLTNEPYGTNSMQVMDIHLPTNRNSSTKVFVMIHGGSWSTNTNYKSFMDTYMFYLKSRFPDAAFYNIEYRLFYIDNFISYNQFPTQENDIESAVNFILNRSSTDNVSQDLILVGHSAGGHLALLQSYKHNQAGHIKAVATFAPPVDLANMIYYNYNLITAPLLNNLTGGNAALLSSSSPVNYISATSPPTITLHGNSDLVVDYSQSTILYNTLAANNVTKELQTFSCEGHDFQPGNLAAGANLIYNFITTYVP